jgi:hypothetical protein
MLSAKDCLSLKGTPTSFISCEALPPAVCPQLGACCRDGFTCTELPLFACPVGGMTTWSPNACSEVKCPVDHPMGCCCAHQLSGYLIDFWSSQEFCVNSVYGGLHAPNCLSCPP